MEIKNGYFEHIQTLESAVAGNEIGGIPAVDQGRVLHLTELLAPSVEEWTKDFLILSLSKEQASRLYSTTLACSAMSPNAPLDAIKQTSVLSLILFALDDVVDGVIGNYTDEQIEDFLTLYSRLATEVGPNQTLAASPPSLQSVMADQRQPGTQVALALAKCCAELRAAPAAVANYPFFARRFALLMESMRTELHWRQQFQQGSSYPAYPEYMLNGRESIVAPSVLAALLVMSGPPLVDHLALVSNLTALLDEVVLTSGSCVRLSNDLRSFGREKMEGKPNSILILTLAQGMTETEATLAVDHETDLYLQRLKELVTLLPVELAKWGEATQRLAWFAKEWYKVREFHAFTKEMLTKLAQNAH